MRRLMWALAASAVTSLGSSANADDNQSLADAVASRVQSLGQVRGYQIDIETQAGVVTLSGTVASASQREALIDNIRTAPGVLAVRDKIAVRDASAQPASELRPVSVNVAESAPAMIATEGNRQVGPVTEPEPVVDYQGGVAPFSDAPTIPPYAWPAYTPYNNFASLAHQTQYPSGAWPFIGPPHPYPMIPSGWRRVSLSWKKGYWWMRFHAH
ncbi:BON domain-containing protein [bacterium]|jgi:hypothetical protein|nr:BON domain-containing protein [bacterium]